MKKEIYQPLIRLLLFFIIAIGFYVIIGYLLSLGYLDNIQSFVETNFYLFIFILFLIKLVGIIFPPIPGGGFLLASVPLIGWPLAFVIDALGSIIGGIFNYYVAKRYSIQFVSKVVGTRAVEKINKIKIKQGKEIESVIILRILMGPIILELIHYAAGLLKVPFNKYLKAIIISQILIGIPSFYFFEVITSGKFKLAFILLVLFALPILYITRKRYIDL